MIRLMLGDCLEKMAEIEPGSVDLIAADLPYGTTQAKWDAIIPLGPMWEVFLRIISPRAAIVLTASQPFTSVLVTSNQTMFRHEWCWSKKTASGYFDANRRPMKAHESILVFSPSSPRYNPQMVSCTEDEMKRKRKRDVICGNGDVYQPGSHRSVGRSRSVKCPTSVIEINGLAPVSAEKQSGRHPTQKPVALFEYLIRTYSNEGEMVLDCTMGSGTTGVACVNTGRNFIGIERDPAYFAIAERRISEAEAATPLLSPA